MSQYQKKSKWAKKAFDAATKGGQEIECIRNDSRLPMAVTLNCFEFTYSCGLTHAPDFAQLNITYLADQRLAETKSLKFYLTQYRYMDVFNEELCYRILLDFVYYVRPLKVEIALAQNPRGGIQNTSHLKWDKQKDWKSVEGYNPKTFKHDSWPILPSINKA